MKYNPTNLIATVSKSVGRDLDVDDADDSFIIHTGCYILNSWDVEPIYDYTKIIIGPFS